MPPSKPLALPRGGLWIIWGPGVAVGRLVPNIHALALPYASTSFFLGQFFKEMAYLGINKCYEKDFFNQQKVIE